MRPLAHVFSPGTAEGRPPLLMLHGTGDDEHGLLPLAATLSPDAAVLSPRGMVLEGTHARYFRRLAEGLFDEDDLRARADELAAFITGASAQYGLAPGSLVAVGFSNGANMAAALLLTHPEVLAGALLIASVPPFTSVPGVDLSGRRVLISNGENDEMAPLERTDMLAHQLRERGADVELLTHPSGHEIVETHLPAMSAFVHGHA